MRHKENSERLEWLQLHVDCRSAELSLDEKLTFNSATNLVPSRSAIFFAFLKFVRQKLYMRSLKTSV
jgi:hypothetical protein